jgi:hypothetical protein
MNKIIRIIILMLLIVIFGSVSHISLPLIVDMYPSIFFIMFTTSIEGILIYGIIFIGRKIYIRGSKVEISMLELFCQHWKIIMAIGISNAAMSIFFFFSANSMRTPVVIQSVFLGLAILSSIFFSKLLLHKRIEYNYPFTIISILFLLGSIGIAIIPIMTETNVDKANFTIGWIFMFMFGVFSYSLTNVLQEKYIRDSDDDSFDNKIFMALASMGFQFLTIITFSWTDLFIGYKSPNHTSFELFQESFNTMTTNVWAFVLLQIFILLWFLLFIIAVFLNEISTNYTMILTNITNQSIALFFIIFPHLNKGIRFPLYITLSSLATSFISVVFWINAEKVIDDNPNKEEEINIASS